MTFFIGEPVSQFLDNNGVPLAGGLVWVYSPNTTTLTNSYSTWGDAVNNENPQPNPVVLNARGECTIIVNGPVGLQLEDANINPSTGHGSLIWNLPYYSNPTLTSSNNFSILDGGTLSLFNTTTYASSFTASESQVGNIDYILPPTGGLDTSTLNVLNNASAAGTLTWASIADIQRAIFPIGMIASFGTTTGITSNWLACNGQNVSRTTYATLFTAIGTTFGVGDGSTTFTLPNMQRRVLMGSGGSSSGTIGSNIGATGGAETHVLTPAELAAHNHTYGNATVALQTGATPIITASTSGSVTNTGNTGSSTGHNNIQPSLIVAFYIFSGA